MSTTSEGEGFAYHDFINATDEQAFDTFVAKCLSTCENSRTNGSCRGTY